MAKNLIVILGPTASGKTSLAAKLAYDLRGEIISADSRQVYKKMDIGTGKDLNQYVIEGRRIPCHMIDILEPDEEFNLFEFQKRFYRIFTELLERKITPILAGGTGLYLESVLGNYDLPEAPEDAKIRKELSRKSKDELQSILLELKPRLHNRTDLENPDRLIKAIEIEMARNKKSQFDNNKPKVDAVIFGIKLERAELRRRITERLKERLQHGMVQEVMNLRAEGLSWARLESFGLEYRFIARYLQDKTTMEEMTIRLNTAIHQFAKRQETWFRRMEKKGILINWISHNNYTLLKESAIKFLR
jgi:tRNA dimethylallyltransferase